MTEDEINEQVVTNLKLEIEVQHDIIFNLQQELKEANRHIVVVEKTLSDSLTRIFDLEH